MKRKLVSKSAFFSLRFLTGFAFCATGVFLALAVFARPNKPVEQQNQSLAQQSIPTFAGMPLTSEIQTGVDRPVPAAVLPEIDLPALPEIPNDKRYERALAQTGGTSVMRLADAQVIPFDFVGEAETIGRYVSDLEKLDHGHNRYRSGCPQCHRWPGRFRRFTIRSGRCPIADGRRRCQRFLGRHLPS